MGEVQRRERKIESERAAIELLDGQIAAYDKKIKTYNSRMRPDLVRPIRSSHRYIGVDGKPERLKDAIIQLLKASMPEGLTTTELLDLLQERFSLAVEGSWGRYMQKNNVTGALRAMVSRGEVSSERHSVRTGGFLNTWKWIKDDVPSLAKLLQAQK
jgi:hypothetical protein